jgi:aldehyde:ferredoxin oxidoreductase
MCKTFSARKIGMPETVLGILNAVTGRDWTESELLKIGERINNLERLFNLREGFKPADDTLPLRTLKEPLPDGGSKGMTVDLEPMLDDYYRFRGWRRENGYPTDEKLKELGLEK